MAVNGTRLGLIGAFLLQTILLGWMLLDRAFLLSSGKEVRLAVVPVDPRDLLRGDYVILSYPISTLRTDQVGGDDNFGYQETVYVTIEPQGEVWDAVSIHRRPPPEGIFLRGTVDYVRNRDRAECRRSSPCADISIIYNLEQFFVPEGRGRDLERLRNDQRVSVDVAISGSGRAALKRLLVDGAVHYQEGLY